MRIADTTVLVTGATGGHRPHPGAPADPRRTAGIWCSSDSLSGKIAHRSGAVYNPTKFGLRGFGQDLHGTGVGNSLVEPTAVRDAGTFAVTHVTAPRVLRVVSPNQVASAVIRAIERNRAEMTVAPRRTRALMALGTQFPTLSERVQRRAHQARHQVGDAHRTDRCPTTHPSPTALEADHA